MFSFVNALYECLGYAFCLILTLSSILLGFGMASLAIGVKKNKYTKGKGNELVLIGTLFGIMGLLIAGSATVYILLYAFVTMTKERWPTSKHFGFVKKRFGL